jgi:Spy/CpxP family protein refolding chaperone
MFSIRLKLRKIMLPSASLLLTLFFVLGVLTPVEAETGIHANTALPKSFSNTAKTGSPMEQMTAREDLMVHEMFQKLHLSSQQQSKILSIVSDARLKNKPLSMQAEQHRAAMLAYLKNKNATLTGAKLRGEKMHDMIGKLAQRRIETWFQIRQQLTPKQLEGLNQLKM